MAGRTLVTAAAGGLIQLNRDGGVALGAGQAADATNMNYVADPLGPNKVAAILVQNGDTSAHTASSSGRAATVCRRRVAPTLVCRSH
jgi:hypothetical protein